MVLDGDPSTVHRAPAPPRWSEIGVRLASTQADVEACQALRYQVFYEDGAAKADSLAFAQKLDADGYDALCDHLMVSDGERVVGTYRLLRQEKLPAGVEFYSQAEFDIAPLLARHASLRFLELGRSCVLKEYRTKRVIEVLWQAIWDYVRLNKLDVMLGCASLPGSDPEQAAPLLSYLQSVHAAPAEWAARAQPAHSIQTGPTLAQNSLEIGNVRRRHRA